MGDFLIFFERSIVLFSDWFLLYLFVYFIMCCYRKENVLRLWNYLLELLLARRVRLELSMAIQRIFHEMVYVLDWCDEIKVLLTF